MSKVKVAVIGCGRIVKERHAPEYAGNPNVELIAFCDPVIERAEQYAREYGGKAYSSYEDMLKNEKPDAVSVCTPNYLHAHATIAAANAGAHVLVEKPMAASEAETAAMIEAARANGVLLMVGHNQRLMPAHIKAKEILHSGIMGKLLTFRSSFCHGGPEDWSIDGRDSWFFRKQEAIMGAMGDLGVHKADLMRWMLDDEVEEVAAMISNLDKEGTDVDDHAICLLRMRSGAIGTIAASWITYKGTDNGTLLWCKNGVIKIDTDPDYQVIVELTDGTVNKYQVGELATNEKQTHSDVIDVFINCIVNGTAPSISGEEGARSLKVILSAFESEETGTIVKI